MSEDLNLESFEEGEKVLFNDRKTPLRVSSVSEDEMVVEGPSGGEYEIYFDGDTLLVSREGNRRYSSYCKKLRSVGEWVREEDTWRHTVSGAEVKIKEKENGFWTISSEKFEDEIDTPMYGFTSREGAVEEIEGFISKHPEG